MIIEASSGLAPDVLYTFIAKTGARVYSNDVLAQIEMIGNRFVMRSAKTGEHSISADPNITNAERLAAHWSGFKANQH
jgi:hypothetical protein